jgi:hypothetical protein
MYGWTALSGSIDTFFVNFKDFKTLQLSSISTQVSQTREV